MGNIVGERFEGYVLNQINSRQKLLGAGYAKDSIRTPQQMQLINNKNAWLKMASSVSVLQDQTPAVYNREQGKYIDDSVNPGEQRLKNIGIEDTANFTGMRLAKQTVLFNTLSQVNPTTEFNEQTNVGLNGDYNFRSGVSTSNALWNSSRSYGLGGTNQGLVPAPGLISFSVESQNRGSIRKGTVELKCFNKFQFELIELVYLRLGYTMMIEWGWDKYTTNSENLLEMGNTIIEDIWFNNSSQDITQLQMIKNIEKYRRLYHGNYDGFYGKVTNFNWTFEPDGTYNITIDLYSVGDVIESIKVDTRSSALSLDKIKSVVSGSTFPKGLGSSPIVTNAGSTALSQAMFTDIVNRKWDEKNSDYLNPSLFFKEKKTEKGDSSASTDRYNYYMTFGALIAKIKEFVVPKIINEHGEAQEMIYFDEGSEEYCAIYPNQIALDPRICLIKPPLTANTKPDSDSRSTEGYVYFDPGWERFKEFAVAEPIGANTTCNYGKIRNIYLNYDFVSQQLAKATKSVGLENQLTLFKFLSAICTGINQSLGGINNLEVIIKDDNLITINEQNPIPGLENIPGLKSRMLEVPSFELFGFNPVNNTSNFVKDFSFDTSITPELASMITIGATANGGSTKNYDGTAFSKWNVGLFDRFNTEMIDPSTSAIIINQIALSERATELGIIPNGEITAQEGVVLYDAFASASLDHDIESFTSDLILTYTDVALTTAENVGYAVDAVAEFGSDIWNSVGNLFRSKENKKPTWGTDNVSNITNPDLSEAVDPYYMANRSSTALGVSFTGQREVPANSVYGKEAPAVTWSEYIQMITDKRIAKRIKEGEGKFTKEELLERFGSNYQFYLTRVFGGDFVAGSNDSDDTLTDPSKATYFQYNSNIINNGKNAFKAYVDTLNNYIYAKTKGLVPSNTIGFIPVSLNINFEGMSGVKIYNQINVRQGFLPSQYPKTFKFLIKTVNHTISDNKWESNIDTVSTPRTFAVGAYSFKDLESSADTYIRSQGGGGGSRQEYFGPAPNAARVREYMGTTGGFITEKRSGQTGNGGYTIGLNPETEEVRGELTSGGDISNDAANMTIAVMKAIREKSPTMRITLTGGNDLYHHNKPKSYTSRHESGNGVDFVIDNPSSENLDICKMVLNSFLVGPKNWWYIDEYGNPTAIASGAHFHMSVGATPEKSGKAQIPIAEQQLREGKITKLP